MFTHTLIPPNVKFEKEFSTLFTLDASGTSKKTFIQAFSTKFIYERGYQFSQYFLPLYKANGIKNLSRDVKLALFNPEAWRYTDYKLSLEELNNEEDLDKTCDIPF
jgi:hypothetical protein